MSVDSSLEQFTGGPAIRSARRPDRRWLTLVPLLAVLTLLFVVPLFSLLVDSFRGGQGFTLENYGEQVTSPVFWRAIRRTLVIAALSTAICVALGYCMAYALTRMPKRLRGVLMVVVLVPYFTSILIRSYAWIAILAPSGLVARALELVGVGTPPDLVFNQTGMLIGTVQILLPLALLPIYSVMSGIDRAAVRAAQSLGASPAVAHWHVYRPATSSAVLAAAALVFISTLGFYVTPALLGGPGDTLIAQSILVQFSNLVDPAGAAAQAALLLLIVLALFAVLFRYLAPSLSVGAADTVRPGRRRGGADPAGRGEALRDARARTLDTGLDILGRLRLPALVGGWVVGAALLVTPLIVVAIWSFSDATYLTFPPGEYSTRWFADYFADETWIGSTFLSLGIASASAAIGVVIGGFGAFGLVRGPRRLRGPVAILVAMPMIVPPMIYSLGFFLLVAPHGLVGTSVGLILPYLVLGLPFSVSITAAALRNLDVRLENAARSLGAGPFSVLRHVLLPALRPALVSGFVFAFLAAFDDVVVATFMSGPTAVTLPLRMFQDIKLEVSPRTAVVAVVLLAAGAAAVLLRFVTAWLVRAVRVALSRQGAS
ncbi:spermidine/putrescine ABC transporter ATP-binding protein [Sphaerisporangium krabiense]|uniref:Putative spermidine/putrescine transport system permease protein n=1 Tax=Sphaerisporangium krabiense TaxID=763782 RepID=A0A7W8Z446_9ACTN|nr:ABC transporter permease subunit [Sphaerisporangium krabiense]MBB5626698.1 putative spermidine/putrescine transport system permease protein [Sphaerisporangium krabiense]GII63617.1 spermidine/putrescine ABC transporter ATP-binding protein [Sphaerisporangium krabiense]